MNDKDEAESKKHRTQNTKKMQFMIVCKEIF